MENPISETDGETTPFTFELVAPNGSIIRLSTSTPSSHGPVQIINSMVEELRCEGVTPKRFNNTFDRISNQAYALLGSVHPSTLCSHLGGFSERAVKDLYFRRKLPLLEMDCLGDESYTRYETVFGLDVDNVALELIPIETSPAENGMAHIKFGPDPKCGAGPLIVPLNGELIPLVEIHGEYVHKSPKKSSIYICFNPTLKPTLSPLVEGLGLEDNLIVSDAKTRPYIPLNDLDDLRGRGERGFHHIMIRGFPRLSYNVTRNLIREESGKVINTAIHPKHEDKICDCLYKELVSYIVSFKGLSRLDGALPQLPSTIGAAR